MHSAAIGLDLAKPWFQVHGVDAAGKECEPSADPARRALERF